MSNGQDRLTQWWESLSADEQAEALEAQRQGRLTPGLMSSLERAGVVPAGQGKGDGSLPGDVERYLKARH